MGAPTKTPEQIVRALLGDIARHDWDHAYAKLANTGDVDKDSFIHDLNGNYGSLRTYSMFSVACLAIFIAVAHFQ